MKANLFAYFLLYLGVVSCKTQLRDENVDASSTLTQEDLQAQGYKIIECAGEHSLVLNYVKNHKGDFLIGKGKVSNFKVPFRFVQLRVDRVNLKGNEDGFWLGSIYENRPGRYDSNNIWQIEPTEWRYRFLAENGKVVPESEREIDEVKLIKNPNTNEKSLVVRFLGKVDTESKIVEEIFDACTVSNETKFCVDLGSKCL